MKFCHVLERASREVPEYKDLFRFYKHMKKQLNKVPKADSSGPNSILAAEGRFVEVLEREMGQLSMFRMDCQGRSTRTLADLEMSLASSCSSEEKYSIYKALVNFHGEALLLMHWSILAYTAIIKLLKKHQKHTGILVQAPHLRELLSQSCWSTQGITGMIAQAETRITQVQLELFGNSRAQTSAADDGEVACPRAVRSPALGSEALLHTLASLADDAGEDSGEDSTGMQDAAAHHQDDQDSASFGSCTNVMPLAPGQGQDTGQGPDVQEDEPILNNDLMQQMEVALQTWEYLQSHASTPSTVLCIAAAP